MSDRLLLVGMGVMGRPYLAAAHAAGRAVVVLDKENNLTSTETRELLGPADRAVAVSGDSDEAWYLAANRALAGERPAGVLAFAEPHVRTAALLADEWRLPGPGLRATETSRNKAYQRALFARHGIAQPDFFLASSAAEAVDRADGFPLVAKALHGTGSNGVRLVTDAADLLDYAKSADSPFLVERYADGPESSCEAIIADGQPVFLSLTDKTTGPPPYFVETKHVVPGPRTEALRPAVERLVDAVVAAMGIGSALLHLEFRHTAAGLSVMEVAVRTPGDFLMDLVRLAHGVDLFAATVALAVGEQPDVTVRRSAAAASWFPTFADGILQVTGSQLAAEAVPGAYRIRLWGQPGTPLAQRSSNDRIASVVLIAPDHAELERRLESVRAALGLSIEPQR
jgi:biotin carboxylase